MKLSTKEYKRRKELVMKQLNVNESEYAELIKRDYHKGAGMIASNHVANLLLNSNGQPRGINNAVLDDWDFVWFYKRNLHIILPEIKEYVYSTEGVDCSDFINMDKDIDIDTVIPTASGPKVTYIRFIKRNIPVRFRSSVCDCTVISLHEDGSTLRFHFCTSNKVRKIFIEKPDRCINCDKCTRVLTVDGFEHVLRPRFRDECNVQECFSEPFGILSIIASIINMYLKREKLCRSRKITPETEIIRKVMVVRHNDNEDTERLLPMSDYVREYHESVRQEWKGGHHASPVSHYRSGYWRKSNHGTHILVNGEFVEVGKGLGNYTYVNSVIVNAGKDSVVKNLL